MHGSRFIFLVLLGLAGAGETHAARAAVGKSEQAPAVESAWSRLDSPARSIREAARREIVAQPFDSWKKRALGETRTRAAFEALTALVEACPAAQAEELRPHICEGITTLHIEGMSAAERLATVRLTRRVFARLGGPSEDERGQMADLWSHFPPAKRSRRADEQQLATELRALLKFLAPPDPAKKQAHHGRGATNQGTVSLGNRACGRDIRCGMNRRLPTGAASFQPPPTGCAGGAQILDQAAVCRAQHGKWALRARGRLAAGSAPLLSLPANPRACG